MERRELYHPEDIEQLLLERAYDDLLEEERAFVLQHLTGRAEYNAMRALLLKMRDDGPSADQGADPHVREHVLHVFRTQQRAQWQVWLNSVALWFWPANARAMWRPALAIASVALVVVIAVVATDRDRSAPQLAEVRLENPDRQEAPPQVTGTPVQPATQPAEQNVAAQRDDLKMLQAAPTEEAPAAADARDETEAPQREEALANGLATDNNARYMDRSVTAVPATVNMKYVQKEAVAPDSVAIAMDAEPTPHAVSANELYTNMSTASDNTRHPTIGEVQRKRESAKDKQQAGAEVVTGWASAGLDVAQQNGTDLLGLLKAAW